MSFSCRLFNSSSACKSLRPLARVSNACAVRLYAKKANAADRKSIEVILVNDLQNIGVRGEILNVRKGFARNFLFPQNHAIYSTPDARKQYEALTNSIDYEARDHLKQVGKRRKRLARVVLRLKRQGVALDEADLPPLDPSEPPPADPNARANVLDDTKVRPHTPIKAADISRKLFLQIGMNVPEETIEIVDGEINSYGTHTVEIDVDGVLVPLQVFLTRR